MKNIIIIALSAVAALSAYATDSVTSEVSSPEIASTIRNDTDMNKCLNAFDDQLHARIVKNLTHPTKISIPGEQKEKLVSESAEQPTQTIAELFAFNTARESQTF